MRPRDYIVLYLDPKTGRVHIRARNDGHRKPASTLESIPREQLRQFADRIHDYADHLDRKDRQKGSRGRGVQIASNEQSPSCSGNSIYPPDPLPPSRTHARTRGGRD